MLEQGLDYVVKLAKSKKQMLDTNPMQYFIRAALAGIYIGFIIVLCFKLGNFFSHCRFTSNLFSCFYVFRNCSRTYYIWWC